MPPHAEGPAPSDAPARPLPPLTWRDRLTDLVGLAAGRPLAAAAVVCGLVVALLVLLPMAQRLAAQPGATPVEASLPLAGGATSSSSAVPTGAGSPSTTSPPGGAPVDGAPVVVHAAGAVADPGVYQLPAGSRVDDLVEAAGGLSPDADGDRVNLALPLVDGERVYVPAVGEVEVPDAPEPSGGGGPPGAGGTAGAGSATAGPVDLNAADLAALEELPGIGPVTAQAIVDHREQQGPFTSVDQLLDVQGIGEARLGQLRALVTV